jgi:hypothetical protein
MPWSPDEEDERPEWEPSRSGPEYHLNRNASPRCILCNMPARIDIDSDPLGPVVRCGNAHCNYIEKLY